MQFRFYVLLVMLCSALPAFSQQPPVVALIDTALYYVNYSTTGFVNRTTDGNSYLLNNGLRFTYQQKKVEANFSGSWIYGAQESGPTNNDYSLIADVNLLKRVKKIYYWGLLAYDKSYSLKIDNRAQLGAGLGYIVVNRPAINVVVSDGPFYEATRLYDTTLYQTVRNSLRIKYELTIRRVVVLEGSNFLQNSLLDGSDYIIKANNSISFKLSSWLSLTAVTTYNKISVSGKENFLCNFGFRFQRYF